MEKSGHPDILDTQLKNLNAALSEPFITEILHDAQTFNSLLQTEATTLEDVKVIIDELDARWNSMLGLVAKVSGFVTKDGESESTYSDDESFVSNGFCINEESDEPITGRRIFLQLMKGPDTDEDTAETTWFHADIDKVSLDFSLASVDRATAWLSTFYPDVIDDVDVCLFKANGTEADAVMGLKEVSMPLFHSEDNEFAVYCLSNYLQSKIEFDRTIPYSVTINGEVIVSDEDGDDVVAALEGTFLLSARTVVAGTRIDENGISGTLNLGGTLLGDDRLKDGIDIKIPMSNVSRFVSLRSVFYEDANM